MVNLLTEDDVEVTGTSTNTAVKTYSLAANAYNSIIAEAEVTLETSGTNTPSIDVAILYGGVTLKTMTISHAGNAGADSAKIALAIKVVDAFTAGGNITLSITQAGVGTWRVEGFRVYATDNYIFGVGAQGSQGLQGLQGGGGQGTQGLQGPSGINYWEQTAAGIHTLSKVGIGTTNPTAFITVKSTSVTDFVGLFSGTTDNDLVRITQDGLGNALRVDDQSGGTTPFVISNIGHVGISTQTAPAALTVNGNASISGITTSSHLDGKPFNTLSGSILAYSYRMLMP